MGALLLGSVLIFLNGALLFGGGASTGFYGMSQMEEHEQ